MEASETEGKSVTLRRKIAAFVFIVLGIIIVMLISQEFYYSENRKSDEVILNDMKHKLLISRNQYKDDRKQNCAYLRMKKTSNKHKKMFEGKKLLSMVFIGIILYKVFPMLQKSLRKIFLKKKSEKVLKCISKPIDNLLEIENLITKTYSKMKSSADSQRGIVEKSYERTNVLEKNSQEQHEMGFDEFVVENIFKLKNDNETKNIFKQISKESNNIREKMKLKIEENTEENSQCTEHEGSGGNFVTETNKDIKFSIHEKSVEKDTENKESLHPVNENSSSEIRKKSSANESKKLSKDSNNKKGKTDADDKEKIRKNLSFFGKLETKEKEISKVRKKRNRKRKEKQINTSISPEKHCEGGQDSFDPAFSVILDQNSEKSTIYDGSHEKQKLGEATEISQNSNDGQQEMEKTDKDKTEKKVLTFEVLGSEEAKDEVKTQEDVSYRQFKSSKDATKFFDLNSCAVREEMSDKITENDNGKQTQLDEVVKSGRDKHKEKEEKATSKKGKKFRSSKNTRGKEKENAKDYGKGTENDFYERKKTDEEKASSQDLNEAKKLGTCCVDKTEKKVPFFEEIKIENAQTKVQVQDKPSCSQDEFYKDDFTFIYHSVPTIQKESNAKRSENYVDEVTLQNEEKTSVQDKNRRNDKAETSNKDKTNYDILVSDDEQRATKLNKVAKPDLESNKQLNKQSNKQSDEILSDENKNEKPPPHHHHQQQLSFEELNSTKQRTISRRILSIFLASSGLIIFLCITSASVLYYNYKCDDSSLLSIPNINIKKSLNANTINVVVEEDIKCFKPELGNEVAKEHGCFTFNLKEDNFAQDEPLMERLNYTNLLSSENICRIDYSIPELPEEHSLHRDKPNVNTEYEKSPISTVFNQAGEGYTQEKISKSLAETKQMKSGTLNNNDKTYTSKEVEEISTFSSKIINASSNAYSNKKDKKDSLGIFSDSKEYQEETRKPLPVNHQFNNDEFKIKHILNESDISNGKQETCQLKYLTVVANKIIVCIICVFFIIAVFIFSLYKCMTLRTSNTNTNESIISLTQPKFKMHLRESSRINFETIKNESITEDRERVSKENKNVQIKQEVQKTTLLNLESFFRKEHDDKIVEKQEEKEFAEVYTEKTKLLHDYGKKTLTVKSPEMYRLKKERQNRKFGNEETEFSKIVQESISISQPKNSEDGEKSCFSAFNVIHAVLLQRQLKEKGKKRRWLEKRILKNRCRLKENTHKMRKQKQTRKKQEKIEKNKQEKNVIKILACEEKRREEMETLNALEENTSICQENNSKSGKKYVESTLKTISDHDGGKNTENNVDESVEETEITNEYKTEKEILSSEEVKSKESKIDVQIQYKNRCSQNKPSKNDDKSISSAFSETLKESDGEVPSGEETRRKETENLNMEQKRTFISEATNFDDDNKSANQISPVEREECKGKNTELDSYEDIQLKESKTHVQILHDAKEKTETSNKEEFEKKVPSSKELRSEETTEEQEQEDSLCSKYKPAEDDIKFVDSKYRAIEEQIRGKKTKIDVDERIRLDQEKKNSQDEHVSKQKAETNETNKTYVEGLFFKEIREVKENVMAVKESSSIHKATHFEDHKKSIDPTSNDAQDEYNGKNTKKDFRKKTELNEDMGTSTNSNNEKENLEKSNKDETEKADKSANPVYNNVPEECKEKNIEIDSYERIELKESETYFQISNDGKEKTEASNTDEFKKKAFSSKEPRCEEAIDVQEQEQLKPAEDGTKFFDFKHKAFQKKISGRKTKIYTDEKTKLDQEKKSSQDEHVKEEKAETSETNKTCMEDLSFKEIREAKETLTAVKENSSFHKATHFKEYKKSFDPVFTVLQEECDKKNTRKILNEGKKTLKNSNDEKENTEISNKGKTEKKVLYSKVRSEALKTEVYIQDERKEIPIKDDNESINFASRAIQVQRVKNRTGGNELCERMQLDDEKRKKAKSKKGNAITKVLSSEEVRSNETETVTVAEGKIVISQRNNHENDKQSFEPSPSGAVPEQPCIEGTEYNIQEKTELDKGAEIRQNLKDEERAKISNKNKFVKKFKSFVKSRSEEDQVEIQAQNETSSSQEKPSEDDFKPIDYSVYVVQEENDRKRAANVDEKQAQLDEGKASTQEKQQSISNKRVSEENENENYQSSFKKFNSTKQKRIGKKILNIFLAFSVFIIFLCITSAVILSHQYKCDDAPLVSTSNMKTEKRLNFDTFKFAIKENFEYSKPELDSIVAKLDVSFTSNLMANNFAKNELLTESLNYTKALSSENICRLDYSISESPKESSFYEMQPYENKALEKISIFTPSIQEAEDITLKKGFKYLAEMKLIKSETVPNCNEIHINKETEKMGIWSLKVSNLFSIGCYSNRKDKTRSLEIFYDSKKCAVETRKVTLFNNQSKNDEFERKYIHTDNDVFNGKQGSYQFKYTFCVSFVTTLFFFTLYKIMSHRKTLCNSNTRTNKSLVSLPQLEIELQLDVLPRNNIYTKENESNTEDRENVSRTKNIKLVEKVRKPTNTNRESHFLKEKNGRISEKQAEFSEVYSTKKNLLHDYRTKNQLDRSTRDSNKSRKFGDVNIKQKVKEKEIKSLTFHRKNSTKMHARSDELSSQSNQRKMNKHKLIAEPSAIPTSFLSSVNKATSGDRPPNFSPSQMPDVIFLQQGDLHFQYSFDRISNYTIEFKIEEKFRIRDRVKYLKYKLEVKNESVNESSS